MWKDFIGGSDLHSKVVLIESIGNKTHGLNEGDIEPQSGSGKPGEPTKSLDNPGIHGWDELEEGHANLCTF